MINNYSNHEVKVLLLIDILMRIKGINNINILFNIKAY